MSVVAGFVCAGGRPFTGRVPEADPSRDVCVPEADPSHDVCAGGITVAVACLLHDHITASFDEL